MAALALFALYTADKSTGGGGSLLIRNGTELWLVRRHTSFGLIWINCELFWPPLVNPQPSMNDLPWWAVPPQREWPTSGLTRVATLAVGWPAPFLARQWQTSRAGDIFPLPHELDDGRDSLRRAAGRFRDRDAAAPLTVLWRGLVINLGVLSLAAGAILWVLSFLWSFLFHGNDRDDGSNQKQERHRERDHA